MKFRYMVVAIAVVIASVVALEDDEENDEFYELLEKRAEMTGEGDLFEELMYGSEPMVKRGRFKYCRNARGDQCVCDRKYRKKNRKRYIHCVPRGKGTPV